MALASGPGIAVNYATCRKSEPGELDLADSRVAVHKGRCHGKVQEEG